MLNRPIISDQEYDQKLKELEELEKQHPEFFDPLSPSQRVGSDSQTEFVQREHAFSMLSLANTYTHQELIDFDERIRRLSANPFSYVCELKFDGAAISLTYENGRLLHALTRGDGIHGDDVTENVKTIRSIPLILEGDDIPQRFEIRGEILIPRSGFKRMNHERMENGEDPFANPRNAASGTLKLLNSSIVASRPLDCYFYYMAADNLPAGTHYDNLMLAVKWGFKVSQHLKKVDTLEEVFKFLDEWQERKEDLDVEIDGAVIKINETQTQLALGFTAKSPRWAIAFKYPADQATTTLDSVDFQVGRTGTITPVANLKPVYLAGTTVKRASIHNEDQINQLDLYQGDQVVIEKGGEIIPKIVGVRVKDRQPGARAVEFVTHCPACGELLERIEGEARHFCPNERNCPPQIKGRITHFIARKGMNIDGLGEETVDVLYQQGLIRDVADLFSLNYGDIIELPRMGDKSANNLLASIDHAKKVPFERVLFALGIRFIGETVAKKMARAAGSMEALLQYTKEELLAIPEVGEVIADSLISFAQKPHHLAMLDRLKQAGLNFELDTTSTQNSNLLEGLTIVVSGVFQLKSRDEIKELIDLHGGKYTSSISKNTAFVVAGDKMGPSKLEKAKKLGIKILSEREFLTLIDSKNS